MDAQFQRIEVRRRGRILELALNNPGKMNRVDALLHEELAHVFRWADDDSSSDVVILTGTGEAFCAGGDVDWMAAVARGEGPAPSAKDGKRMVRDLMDLDKPILAKVRGPAIGLGCTLALYCDVVFVSETARLADPHVRVGLAPGDGGAAIWTALLGPQRAKAYLMSGDAVSGGDAAALGLAWKCVADGDLDSAVEAYATKLVGLPRQAVRAAKRSVNLELERLTLTVFEASMALEGASFRDPEHHEAVAAFREKRPAVYQR